MQFDSKRKAYINNHIKYAQAHVVFDPSPADQRPKQLYAPSLYKSKDSNRRKALTSHVDERYTNASLESSRVSHSQLFPPQVNGVGKHTQTLSLAALPCFEFHTLHLSQSIGGVTCCLGKTSSTAPRIKSDEPLLTYIYTYTYAAAGMNAAEYVFVSIAHSHAISNIPITVRAFQPRKYILKQQNIQQKVTR